MIRAIVKYGDPVLATRAEAVVEFDENLRRLVADMFETMYAAPGVGLAAPQVGISSRLFVMDCTNGKDPSRKFTFVNPVIEIIEGSETGEEGCLSVPGFSFDIKRPTRVVVHGSDASGQPLSLEAAGLEARCVCHEVDHLDGRLLISRISALKRDLTVRKIKKRIKTGDW